MQQFRELLRKLAVNDDITVLLVDVVTRGRVALVSTGLFLAFVASSTIIFYFIKVRRAPAPAPSRPAQWNGAPLPSRPHRPASNRCTSLAPSERALVRCHSLYLCAAQHGSHACRG